MRRPPSQGSFITYSVISFAYAIGLIQTIAAYLAYLSVFQFNGFSAQSLVGAGPHYRDNWSTLGSERKSFFLNLCIDQGDFILPDGSCDNESFASFRSDVLSQAQAAYFIVFIVSQVANCIGLRTRLRSSFEFGRRLTNINLFLCLAVGVLFSVIIVVTPAVNSCFFFAAPPVNAVAVSLWVIPVILVFQESLKAWARAKERNESMVEFHTAFQ
jgi:magnesium-transporting ATPase (P-type)